MGFAYLNEIHLHPIATTHWEYFLKPFLITYWFEMYAVQDRNLFNLIQDTIMYRIEGIWNVIRLNIILLHVLIILTIGLARFRNTITKNPVVLTLLPQSRIRINEFLTVL